VGRSAEGPLAGLASAREALARRLVDEVRPKAELDALVRGVAESIAGNAKMTIRSAKIVLRDLERPAAERDTARLEESIATCYASAGNAEGIRAFQAKRPGLACTHWR
jgi:enoyl-CoA hydratase/carnithine racemase